jgi:hypothetical protein
MKKPLNDATERHTFINYINDQVAVITEDQPKRESSRTRQRRHLNAFKQGSRPWHSSLKRLKACISKAADDRKRDIAHLVGASGADRRHEPPADRRRRFLLVAACSVAALTTLSVPLASLAAVEKIIDVTKSPYLADPSAAKDSSSAFQAALSQIETWGCGVLWVPPGRYQLGEPISIKNASLSIIGGGQASTILLVMHDQTALSCACDSNSQCITLRDFGMAPTPTSGGAAGMALDISFPNMESAWQHCIIENVDLGPAQPNYTCFKFGICFTNVWRANLRNVNFHSNIGNVPGGYFTALNGFCIDNRFNNCSWDGCDQGVVVNDYCEGLHFNDCVMLGNGGVSTGSTSYSGNGSTTPLINLLGLYIANCEINCRVFGLNLYQVVGAWISMTHVGNYTPGVAAVGVLGCTNVHIQGCTLTGQFNSAAAQQFYGIGVRASSAGALSNGVYVDDCDFQNLQVGVVFAAGSINCTATGIRFFAPGLGALLTSPVAVGGLTLQPVLDQSGSTKNVAQWIGSSSGASSVSGRFQYNQR